MGRVPTPLWIAWAVFGALSLAGLGRLTDAWVLGAAVAIAWLLLALFAFVWAFVVFFRGLGVLVHRWVDARLARP